MSTATDWIGAVGQAVGAVGTFIAVGVALWLAQRDSRRRDAEARRAQAQEITGWLNAEDFNLAEERGKIICTLCNASTQPVFDVVVNLVAIHGAFRRTVAGKKDMMFDTYVGILPPGTRCYFLDYPGAVLQVRYGVEVAFRDTAGRFWWRDGNGNLQEVFKEPAVLFGSGPPPPSPAESVLPDTAVGSVQSLVG
jgi:hypothetical protein